MYVYDIEEEDTLSVDWAISSTNIIIITGLEPTYSYLCEIIEFYIKSCYYSNNISGYTVTCALVNKHVLTCFIEDN